MKTIKSNILENFITERNTEKGKLYIKGEKFKNSKELFMMASLLKELLLIKIVESTKDKSKI